MDVLSINNERSGLSEILICLERFLFNWQPSKKGGKKMKKHILIIWMIFALLVLTSATSYADDEIINGCYKKNDGQLRVVDNLDDCRPSELPISWNKEGPAEALGYEVVLESTAQNSDDSKFLNVECPPEKVAIGGGVRVFGDYAGIAIVANGPEGTTSAPESWSGLAQDLTSTSTGWGLRVDVFCVNAP